MKILALLVGGTLVACAGDAKTTDIQSELEKADGGFDTADEAPMFGDEADFAELELDSDTAAVEPAQPGEVALEVEHTTGTNDCLGGTMHGGWEQKADRGHFRGVVDDRHHTKVGHVRGIFGKRHNGERVLFGKFIDEAGHFKGIIKGTWGDGKLRAHWKIEHDEDHGRIRGRYSRADHDRDHDHDGAHFRLHWEQVDCAHDND